MDTASSSSSSSSSEHSSSDPKAVSNSRWPTNWLRLLPTVGWLGEPFSRVLEAQGETAGPIQGSTTVENGWPRDFDLPAGFTIMNDPSETTYDVSDIIVSLGYGEADDVIRSVSPEDGIVVSQKIHPDISAHQSGVENLATVTFKEPHLLSPHVWMGMPKVMNAFDKFNPNDFPTFPMSNDPGYFCKIIVQGTTTSNVTLPPGTLNAKGFPLESYVVPPAYGAVSWDNGIPIALEVGTAMNQAFFFTNWSDERRVFTLRCGKRAHNFALQPLERVQFSCSGFELIEATPLKTLCHKLRWAPNTFQGVIYHPEALTTVRHVDKPLEDDPNLTVLARNHTFLHCPGNRIPVRYPIRHEPEDRPSLRHSEGLAFYLRTLITVIMIGAVLGCSPPLIERCETCYLPAGAVCTSNSQCNSNSCFLTCAAGESACPVGVHCTPQGNCSKSSNLCCTSSSNCPGPETCRFNSQGGVCKRECGESCLVSEDCAFGSCPAGGGVCSNCILNTNPRTPAAHCCQAGVARPIGSCFASPSPSSTFVMASVTSSLSPSATLMAEISSSITPSPAASPTPSPTGTFFASATGSVTTTLSNSAAMMRQFHQAHLPVSSAVRMTPFYLLLLESFVNAAKCLNGRILSVFSEEMEAGGPLEAECEEAGCPFNYTSRALWGFNVADRSDFLECPNPNPPRVYERAHKVLQRDLLVSDNIMAVNLDGNLFTISFSQPSSLGRTIVISLQGQAHPAVCEGLICFITVAEELMYTSSTGVVYAYEADQLINTATFEVTGQRPCLVADCWFCNLSSWSCIPAFYKAALVIFIILAGIIIIYYSFKIGLFTFACIWLALTGGVGFLREVRDVFWERINDWREARKDAREKRMAAAAAGQRAPAPDTVTGRTQVLRPVSYTRIARNSMVLFAIIGLCSACDSSIVLSNSLTNCVTSGAEKACQVELDTTASLKSVGSSVCLVFEDQGEAVGQIEISLDNNMLSCLLDEFYFTSVYTIHTANKFHCVGSLSSNCSSDCTESADLSHYFGPEDFLSYPGGYMCNRLCGTGLTCGCVLPTPGCDYMRYAFLPSGQMTRVSHYSICNSSPTLTYKVTDGKGLVTSGSFSYDGVLEFDDKLEIQILSSIERPVPQGLPGFLCEGSRSYFCDASAKGYPKAGSIGDIQADNNTGLSSGQFIWAPDIIIGTNTQKKNVKLLTREPGLREEGKALPSSHSGLIWSTDSDGSAYATKFFSFDTRPSPLQVGIRTVGNFTVSKTTYVVCPEARDLKVTGCHSCPQGYILEFEARSSCLKGTVSARAATIPYQSITLDTVFNRFSLTGFSNDSKLEDTLTLKDRTFKFEGELSEGIQLAQESILYFGDKPDPAHVQFRKGNWKWWEYLIASIIMLMAFLLLLGLVVGLVPLFGCLASVLTKVKLKRA